MFARLTSQRVVKNALVTTTKRFRGNHPPSEHPYFDETNPLYTKWAYTRFTPNSTYGDKFAHPMNYQGHVPVTPTKFTDSNFKGGAPEYLYRAPNYPTVYFISAIFAAGFTTYVSIYATQRWLLSNGGFILPLKAVPQHFSKTYTDIVQLQGGRYITGVSNNDGKVRKNVYETQEFQTKLQEYITKRNNDPNFTPPKPRPLQLL